MKKPEIQILIGNIGAGKSTYCRKKAKEGYLVISKDQLRYALGAGTYLFNPVYEQSIHETIITLIENLMDAKVNLIIDETNMDKETRNVYLNLAYCYNYKQIAVVFPKLSKYHSVKRRLKDNHGNTLKAVWEDVWQRKNDNYEKPTRIEGFNKVVYL